jgi:hypothetical protein
LASEGLPFVLERYRLLGMAAMSAALAGEPWLPQPQRPPREVVGEMPLDNMVVEVASSAATPLSDRR